MIMQSRTQLFSKQFATYANDHRCEFVHVRGAQTPCSIENRSSLIRALDDRLRSNTRNNAITNDVVR